jgi:hypothetical protein
MVRRVGVETALDRASGQLERPAPRRRLDGFEVQAVDRARAYKCLDLGRDLRRERLFEAPFFPTSVSAVTASSSVSAHLSQACQ